MYGDKETFWIGFEIVGDRYAFNPTNPGSISEKVVPGNIPKVCSIQLLHVDENNRPSWINGGLYRNKNLDDYNLVNPKYWAVEPGVWDFSVGHMACLLPASTISIKKLSAFSEGIIAKTTNLFEKHQKSMSDVLHVKKKISKWSYDNVICEKTVFDFQNPHDRERFDHVARSVSDYDALKYRHELLKFTKSVDGQETLQKGSRGIIYFSLSSEMPEWNSLIKSVKHLRSGGSDLPVEIW